MEVSAIYNKTEALPEEAQLDAIRGVLERELRDWTYNMVGARRVAIRGKGQPHDLVAGDYEYAQIGLLGNEEMRFVGTYVGKKNGLILCFLSDQVVGREGEELFIEVPISVARAHMQGSNKESVSHTVAVLVTEALINVDPDRIIEEEKERARLEEERIKRERAMEIQEVYGHSWGTWG